MPRSRPRTARCMRRRSRQRCRSRWGGRGGALGCAWHFSCWRDAAAWLAKVRRLAVALLEKSKRRTAHGCAASWAAPRPLLGVLRLCCCSLPSRRQTCRHLPSPPKLAAELVQRNQVSFLLSLECMAHGSSRASRSACCGCQPATECPAPVCSRMQPCTAALRQCRGLQHAEPARLSWLCRLAPRAARTSWLLWWVTRVPRSRCCGPWARWRCCSRRWTTAPSPPPRRTGGLPAAAAAAALGPPCMVT